MAAKKVDALEEKLDLEVGLLRASVEERLTTVEEKLAPRLQGVDDWVAAPEAKLDLLFGLIARSKPREPSPWRNKGTSSGGLGTEEP